MVVIDHVVNFKDKHKGGDIYVVGSGKSIDFYPAGFLNDKITIGVNQISRVVGCTYYVRKELPPLMSAEVLLSDITLFLTMSKYGNHATHKNSNLILVSNHTGQNERTKIVLFDHNSNVHRVPDRLPDDPNALLVSHSTITTAIHLAAYMGAKNIFIAGHDLGSINGQLNCAGYHSVESRQCSWHGDNDEVIRQYKDWLRKIGGDTLKARALLQEKYSCNIFTLSPFIGFGFDGNTFS